MASAEGSEATEDGARRVESGGCCCDDDALAGATRKFWNLDSNSAKNDRISGVKAECDAGSVIFGVCDERNVSLKAMRRMEGCLTQRKYSTKNLKRLTFVRNERLEPPKRPEILCEAHAGHDDVLGDDLGLFENAEREV